MKGRHERGKEMKEKKEAEKKESEKLANSLHVLISARLAVYQHDCQSTGWILFVYCSPGQPARPLQGRRSDVLALKSEITAAPR